MRLGYMCSVVIVVVVLVGLRTNDELNRFAEPRGAVVMSEFIFDQAPFPSCHASTIAETKSGLVAAWFGGTAERNPDVGIWVSRHEGSRWTAPVEVANGVQH